MRQQRWFPIAALAAGLFAINVIARLVIRFGFRDDDAAQTGASTAMFAGIGLMLAVWTFIHAQRRPPIEWLLPDLVLGALGGMLLTILIGPFLSGGRPFANGAGDFFSQIWLYGGFAIAGTLVGYWVAVMLARDHRSRSLAALAAATQARASRRQAGGARTRREQVPARTRREHQVRGQAGGASRVK